MMKSKVPLTWTELDPNTLDSDAKAAYETVRHCLTKTKAAQQELEKLIVQATNLPDDHRLVFSYRFGNLSVAVDLVKPKRAIHFETLKAAVRKA